MIKFENLEVVGLEHAIRGMRNPMNSWDKSDSVYDWGFTALGRNDYGLATKLAQAGPVHAKYRRMIVVYVDITAPLYWWKEFDTYKVGTVANSCSTMHKIANKEFTLENFSCNKLIDERFDVDDHCPGSIFSATQEFRTSSTCIFEVLLDVLNHYRELYLKTQDKKYWWQLIQLLPTSYNQRRTVMMNYEVLAGIYPMRKDHKLDEWRTFCGWIEELPYSELITVGKAGTDRTNGMNGADGTDD